MAAKKPISYDSSHIESLSGLDGIRKNPAMYLGSTDGAGVFLTARELLDNALDEHFAGRNTAVWLHIDKDGSFWVADKGQGIPQGIKEVHIHVNGKDVINKVPTMQAVFGELHTSGKYRSDAYKVSIGTHGVGSKGTNATSEFFNVVTCYKKKWYSIGFTKGRLTSPVKALLKAPNGPDGKPLNGGTCIHYKPDPKIFSVKTFPPSMMVDWAEIMSYLNPGFAIIVSSPKGRKLFMSKLGPAEYVTNRVKSLKAELLEDTFFDYRSDLADVVVSFTSYDGCDIRGFTSGLANPQGGTHVNSVNSALYDGLKAALTKLKKKVTFSTSDFKEGLVGLVNAKLHKAQYSSQDKARLTDSRTGADFTKALTVATTAFFLKNKSLTLKLHERATQLNALKIDFNKSKKLIKALNAIRSKGMPGKYAPANKGIKAADRELFLVEGDSAGGSVKTARLPFQAVLPLKGKVMNAVKAKGGKALESEEITHILGAIGFDPKAADPYEKLQVGKICLLADPDPDGCHINVLLLALFYRYLPRLFELGMIYVVETPEFYAIYKDTVFSGANLSSVSAKMKAANVPASIDIHHIKGWGEISPQLLCMLALAPSSRTLIQINPINSEDADFDKLMNDDVEFRKALLGIK